MSGHTKNDPPFKIASKSFTHEFEYELKDTHIIESVKKVDPIMKVESVKKVEPIMKADPVKKVEIDSVPTIILDTRELLLRETLSRKLSQKIKGQVPSFVVQALPVGDIHIVYNPLVKNSSDVIIERKTLQDLSSSIKERDQRYRDQKKRMLLLRENCIKQQITPPILMYIIETPGLITDKYGLKKESYLGTIINLMLRDSIYVLRTHDHDETSDFILRICANKDKFIRSHSNVHDSVCPVGQQRKELVDSRSSFAVYLNQIPGISERIAYMIADKYSSVGYLIYTYLNIQSIKEREELLSEIQTSDKRKLGKIISKRVYKIAFNIK